VYFGGWYYLYVKTAMVCLIVAARYMNFINTNVEHINNFTTMKIQLLSFYSARF